MLYFNWTEPFDNGGSEIQDYDVLIKRVIDNEETSFNVVNAKNFKYTALHGLLAGHEYRIKVRAKNFFTEYFSQLAPFSAVTTFFTSVLPKPVKKLSYDIASRTKTDVVVDWELHLT